MHIDFEKGTTVAEAKTQTKIILEASAKVQEDAQDTVVKKGSGRDYKVTTTPSKDKHMKI